MIGDAERFTIGTRDRDLHNPSKIPHVAVCERVGRKDVGCFRRFHIDTELRTAGVVTIEIVISERACRNIRDLILDLRIEIRRRYFHSLVREILIDSRVDADRTLGF